jgi:hypothetical protein
MSGATEPATEPAPTVEPVTVVEALAGVMERVQSISKASRNTTQNFNFRGIDAVMNAVGPAFRECGVICIPVRAEWSDERYETKSGTHMRGVTVTVTFRFYGPAGDYIEAQACGEAADAGDKAVPKAHSVAYRTLLLQALCIPTDEADPDASVHERAAPRRQEGPPPMPVPKGWAEIEKMIRGADNSEEAWLLFSAFVRAASYHLFGKTDSAELEKSEKDTLYRKAAGASVWLVENVENEGPFFFYDEAAQRRAWAAMLDGVALPIPDYVPPEPPLDPKAQEEAERIAAEVFEGAGESAPPEPDVES